MGAEVQKYCTVCRKFVKELGFAYLRVCLPEGHEIKDKTWDDIYKSRGKN